MTDITRFDGWKAEQAKNTGLFRNAVRLRADALVDERGQEVRKRTFRLLAENLVRTADLHGFVVPVETEGAIDSMEQLFDFGCKVGLGGSLRCRFIGTREQYERWLVEEIEAAKGRASMAESAASTARAGFQRRLRWYRTRLRNVLARRKKP